MKTKQEISTEIKTDIDKGIYQMFPKLKSRLQFIGNKLFSGAYIINGDYQLSRGEWETLAENDYINKEDINDYLENQK